uniref:Uncharacterized protein n=1 Tax=Avena sativa TaxID=4498 RepID=A0ACD5XI67_AVESA
MPKSEGGLGIRNLQARNMGLILSAAWRIAEKPNSFLHDILKAKYFPSSSIWRPKPNTPKSAFWSSVLKVLPILLQNSWIQLCNGSSSIWSSPWFNGWENIYDNLILQNRDFNYPATINQLWIPGRKEWNYSLVDSLFLQPAAQAIKNTTIVPTEEDDILCWNLTPSGKCNSKSTYRACLQMLFDTGTPSPDQVQESIKNIMKQVWRCKEMIPRIKTFAWRLLRRALATGDRASQFSRHIDKVCSRCGIPETDLHLFFLCPFAKAAWFLPLLFVKTEMLVANFPDISHIILDLLAQGHPTLNLNFLFTFL